MSNDYATKLDKAHAEMDAAGIWPSNYNPPAYKAARKLGFKIKPPHYQSALIQAVFMGCVFGPIYGGITTLSGMYQSSGLNTAITTSLIAGALFGIAMALMTQIRQRQKKLSRWDDL